MRVLLVNQHYSPDTAATAQLLQDLAWGLVKKGHVVHVLCSRRMYRGGGRLPANEIYEEIHVHRVRATGFGRLVTLGRIMDWLSFYILAMGRALRLPRMDVVVCLTTPPLIGVVGLLLRWIKGTRLVIWNMDMYPEIAVACGYLRRNSLTHWITAQINRGLYRSASCIISLGQEMTKRLIDAGADPRTIATVHNWAPGAAFAKLAPATLLEEVTVLPFRRESTHSPSPAGAAALTENTASSPAAEQAPQKRGQRKRAELNHLRWTVEA